MVLCPGHESKLLTPINWCQASLCPHTGCCGWSGSIISTYLPTSLYVYTLLWPYIACQPSLLLPLYDVHSKLTYWVRPPLALPSTVNSREGIVPALCEHCARLIDLLTSVTQDTPPRCKHTTMHYAPHNLHYAFCAAFYASWIMRYTSCTVHDSAC